MDADWLESNITAVELADVRWSIADGPKVDAFREGHLPGAVFVDLDADLSDPPGSRGRHPLPSVDRFRHTLIRLGLGRRPTVCYDDTSGATAARLWWMLDAIGHPAAVLDGGMAAWSGPWEGGHDHLRPAGEAGPRAATEVIGDPARTGWPVERVVAVDVIAGRIEAGSTLLDARSADRFRGEPNPIDPVAGHIPGGRSRPWTDNVEPNGNLKPGHRLRREFASLGVDGGGEWLASCGSGVTACHNLLAGRVAGLEDGRLYAGSWSEWIGDPSRPVETGDGDGADGFSGPQTAR